MDPWTSLRAEFESVERWLYLDHAAVSPLPLRARAGTTAYLDELGRHGAVHYGTFLADTLHRARTLGAGLMNARPEDVFMVRSTTQGLSVAATGLGAEAGDNVVLVAREFPANVRPWLPLRGRGVELRFVEQVDGRVPLDALAAAVDGRTRAVSVSFVQFLSGFRIDLGAVAELCRKVDALFVVDAIQGLGVFPVDVARDGIDLLSADSHKWMMGPEGAGLGYASPRARERLEPAVQGWLGVERPFDFFDLEQPLKAGADRYEEGAYNHAGLRGMNGSLELIAERGPAAFAARLLALTDHLEEGLRRLGWTVLSPRATDAEKSGIVLFTKASLDTAPLARRLRDQGIVVSLRGGAVRASPHAYQTPEDLDRFLEVLGPA